MDIEKLIREYIDKSLHMSLATVHNDKPWVCELHFAYDQQLNIYYRSLTSRRHSQEITTNPNVAGNIVRQHGIDEPPEGVYFEGKAALLPAGEERSKAFECIKKRLATGDDILTQADDPAGHQFYKVTVDTFYLFGEFTEEGNRKYELKWISA